MMQYKTLLVLIFSIFLFSCGSQSQQNTETVFLNIPKEFSKYFESCPGSPSIERTKDVGRAVVVGYCEHSGKKFVQFTIDDPKLVNLLPIPSPSEVKKTNIKNDEAKDQQVPVNKPVPQVSDTALKLITVPIGTQGHPFYLSPRNFAQVGQSFALDQPIKLTAIGVAINQRVTLLTPEGVELFRQDSTGMSLSKSKANEVEKALFDPDYEFQAKVEVNLYKHKSGPIPSNFDIRDPNFELIFNEVKNSTIYLENTYKSKLNNELKLPAGYYLIIWKITQTPENILTIFLSGRPEKLDGSNNAYLYGRTYKANNESEFSFNEHPTKSGEVDASGQDIWCRGDLQIFVEGEILRGEEINLEKITDPPKGNAPDIQNCWSVGKRP